MFNPRPKQAEILKYTGGRMGISAVPGSGKTHTLSALAAKIIQSGVLGEDQEVLVVTLVNSAVANFSNRVEGFLAGTGALPGFQYRVRTLHGLANDIVHERPALSGLPNDFGIIDEREAQQLIIRLVTAWYREHTSVVEDLLEPNISQGQLMKVRKDNIPELLQDIATAFIRTVKDRQLSEEQVAEIARGSALSHGFELLEMCCRVYAEYQRDLRYRACVDFDDLIRLALGALRSDDSLLSRLQMRWPYILEDEAQDSSLLQQEILELLAGGSNNWVRVGDPNQAIFATFTTANPRYLRDFIRNKAGGVIPRELPDSGRSTLSIINLANHLVRWTRESYPLPEVRDALDEPYITPVPEGHANPNPDDSLSIIHVHDARLEPDIELEKVADSIGRWLPGHKEATVAVLCAGNRHLEKMAGVLKQRGIPAVELLRSTSATRRAAGWLESVLRFLALPRSNSNATAAFRAWRSAKTWPAELTADDDAAANLLKKCGRIEEYLYPRPLDWMDRLDIESQPQVDNLLRDFKIEAHKWLEAITLPVDDLVIFLAGELFHEPADLAVAYKIAAMLAASAGLHPEWRLEDFAREAAMITGMGRKFTGFSDEDEGFDPEKHKGKVVLATIHKAKGLEWDRVYLVSVNKYDFPSGAESDEYMSERWFLKGRLNLQAEVLRQLDLALAGNPESYIPGAATLDDRLHYIRERLRLMYVGITRARRELLFSWNTGLSKKSGPALALTEIKDYLTFQDLSARKEE